MIKKSYIKELILNKILLVNRNILVEKNDNIKRLNLKKWFLLMLIVLLFDFKRIGLVLFEKINKSYV